MKTNDWQIAFRVDASDQIGTGHFMRCLTLADALRKRGAATRFVSRHLPPHLRAKLEVSGHDFSLLEGALGNVATKGLSHAHWLGVSQAQDAADSIRALSDQNWDWLIVDHYALDSQWESKLRKSTDKILAIDDIADRSHDCDVLLDQNLYTDRGQRYTDKIPEHCLQFLGPRYALLREDFRKLNEQIKPRNGVVRRMLISFGGVDANDYTGRAIAAVAELSIPEIHVDVVIGAQHPVRQHIEAECARHGFDCHVQSDKMAELMAAADLAIGAGGIATWERCCMGLPTLALVIAENQRLQVLDAAKAGLLIMPEIKGDLKHSIQKHTETLLENERLRELVSLNCLKAIDGRGVSRIIKEMNKIEAEEKVRIKRAGTGDSMIVWPWRNHEATRQYFFDPSSISLPTHLEWWSKCLSNPKRLLLLASLKEKAFGVIRYDLLEQSQARVSIYLDPEMTGKGLGQVALKASQKWLRKHHQEVDTIIAEVIPDNLSSKNAFLLAGFKEQYTIYSCIND